MQFNLYEWTVVVIIIPIAGVLLATTLTLETKK